jgi:cytochrome c556
MSQKAKQIGWATWPALVMILAAGVVSSGAIHAESIVPALHATMRTMRASLAQIGEFAKGNGEQTAALDSAMKVVTLAKSIPAIFPPGSELTELPSKGGAAPTSWDDVDRFLDAQKRLVIETSKLLAAVNDGNKEAIGRQLETTSNFATDCPCGGTLVFRPGQSTTSSKAHPHFTGWHTACCSLPQRALEAGMHRSRQSIHHF